MARYKMTVVFDVHEEVAMKYVLQEQIDNAESDVGLRLKTKQPHINKLYDDVIERIDTSFKHPITYDIISFEKLKEK
jgi:hypothetical protein